MDIWQTGNPQVDVRERTGWLARYFDADGHFKGNPLSGITLGSALPLTLFSDDVPASVIGGGADFGFGAMPGTKISQMDTLRALYAEGTVAGSNAEFVRNVGSEAYSSSPGAEKSVQGLRLSRPPTPRSTRKAAWRRACKPSPSSSPAGWGRACITSISAASIPTPTSRASTPIFSASWPTALPAFYADLEDAGPG